MSTKRQNDDTKAVVSVSEMARMVGLSRQRFHQLVQAGVFPQPQRHEGRPYYDEPTQQICLEVRRRNRGVNGQVVLFYSRRLVAVTRPTTPKKVTPAPAMHADLLDGLRALGLVSVTTADVAEAIKSLYPQGTTGIDEGEVLRGVFLHLQSASQR